jgi:hypothetical protein
MLTKKRIHTYLITFIILAFGYNVQAQDSYIKNRWNTKIGFSVYSKSKFSRSSFRYGKPHFRLEANYGILENLEIGGYLGVSQISVYNLVQSSISEQSQGIVVKEEKRPMASYGLTANYHLLPYLVKGNNFRIDLYVSGKYGGITVVVPKNYSKAEYALYGGLAYYIGNHWGFYGEYGLGNYTKLRYGLSFKW